MKASGRKSVTGLSRKPSRKRGKWPKVNIDKKMEEVGFERWTFRAIVVRRRSKPGTLAA
jgi:hypothetical protein